MSDFPFFESAGGWLKFRKKPQPAAAGVVGPTGQRYHYRFRLADGVLSHSEGSSLLVNKRMEDLLRLYLVTTDDGPLLDDLFMVFEFADEKIVIPSEHPDWQAIYDALIKTMDIDLQAYGNAMSCTDNAEFTLWSLEPPGT